MKPDRWRWERPFVNRRRGGRDSTYPNLARRCGVSPKDEWPSPLGPPSKEGGGAMKGLNLVARCTAHGKGHGTNRRHPTPHTRHLPHTGLYTPHTPRITSEISPTAQRARTASMIGTLHRAVASRAAHSR